jgi:hypothetical protein
MEMETIVQLNLKENTMNTKDVIIDLEKSLQDLVSNINLCSIRLIDLSHQFLSFAVRNGTINQFAKTTKALSNILGEAIVCKAGRSSIHNWILTIEGSICLIQYSKRGLSARVDKNLSQKQRLKMLERLSKIGTEDFKELK